ncbi:MAG: hypothetical protein EXR05_04720 [Acetobacteraceae bacterium]|nr:hypothetical protein [Acetobacteraceae bacterium]
MASSVPLVPRRRLRPVLHRGLHAGAVPHWGYAGAEGPEHWDDMSADYRVCSLGQQQTPINLLEAVRAQPGDPANSPVGAVSPNG